MKEVKKSTSLVICNRAWAEKASSMQQPSLSRQSGWMAGKTS